MSPRDGSHRSARPSERTAQYAGSDGIPRSWMEATAPAAPPSGSPTDEPVTASQTRTVPSSPAVTSQGGSPEAAVSPGSGTAHTLWTSPVCPVSGRPTGRPVATSHKRTVPSPPVEASRKRPSGSSAAADAGTAHTARAGPVCPMNGSPTCRPTTGSQIRTLASTPAEASQLLPSAFPDLSAPGTALTQLTLPTCPVNGWLTRRPVTGSQIRTLPSPPAEATQSVSPAPATAQTP
jgi:hypothetical protein